MWLPIGWAKGPPPPPLPPSLIQPMWSSRPAYRRWPWEKREPIRFKKKFSYICTQLRLINFGDLDPLWHPTVQWTVCTDKFSLVSPRSSWPYWWTYPCLPWWLLSDTRLSLLVRQGLLFLLFILLMFLFLFQFLVLKYLQSPRQTQCCLSVCLQEEVTALCTIASFNFTQLLFLFLCAAIK